MQTAFDWDEVNTLIAILNKPSSDSHKIIRLFVAFSNTRK